jgi:hypothetical protein
MAPLVSGKPSVEFWHEFAEIHHTMLLSDARQTSPPAAKAPLPHRSVCPTDLDLRQVPRASERRGHEVQSRSNLGPGRRPWGRTGALRRCDTIPLVDGTHRYGAYYFNGGIANNQIVG